MAKENKVEVEAGIPGLAKAKISRAETLKETKYCYSCEINFASLEATMEFRDVVEKTASEKGAIIAQSHIDTVEITKK